MWETEDHKSSVFVGRVIRLLTFGNITRVLLRVCNYSVSSQTQPKITRVFVGRTCNYFVGNNTQTKITRVLYL